MTSECDNLDAYLVDNLPAGAAAQFAQHVDRCTSCHEAVEQQRWIDSLLSSDACAKLEPIPAALHETLRASIASSRHTGRLIAYGLAAAATIAIVAAGWTLMQTRHAEKSHHPTVSNIAVNNAPPPRATFVSNGDTIAVPLESTDDDVTIVQLYPTTETERRMRRELAIQFIYSESNGG